MDNHDCGQIVKKLSGILKDAECPMCHSKGFFPLDSFLINTLSKDESSGPVIVSDTLPCVPMVCANCGLVTQHSVFVLLEKLKNGN